MNGFSKDFIENGKYSPLVETINKCVWSGCSPYQIIEELVVVIEKQQKELAEIKTHGAPPIIVTVSKEEFEYLKKNVNIKTGLKL